ncbi:MAG TPA: amino acid adenylation domain-containing protein [Thermoanaerobaculia bacterium]|nr:amino acid adenylation domain-containing protein [Thermoanaerobaculia bacterium]
MRGGLAEVMERLTPEQRRRLQERLDREAAATVSAAEPADGEAIRPREGGAPPPLSFAQQRLWFLEQLSPELKAYNLGHALELVGRVEVAALASVVDELVARHETLRTRFVLPAGGGDPVQEIQPAAAVPLPVVDLSALPEVAGDELALALAGRLVARPYDLARGELLRLALLRQAPRRHLLAVAMHHIVSDGWSFGIFVREVSQLYQARLAGRPSPLPPLPVQYADFAVWQRTRLQGEVLERLLAFWRESLADAPAVIDLPFDRPRRPLISPRGGQVPLELPAPRVAEAEAFARGSGASLFMLLLAAMAAFLSRVTGQRDLVIGTPLAGRTRSEIEGLIGFFINSLPLRVRVAPGASFVEVLDQVRSRLPQALAHQDLPFERLVEELRPERDLAQAPIFQVVLSLLTTPLGNLELPGLELVPRALESDRALVDLTIDLAPQGGRLVGTLDYNRDLFDPATAERLAGAWRRALEGALEDPTRQVSALPLLSPGEERQLLVEWNATGRTWPFAGFCHELVLGWAEKRPDAVAVGLAGEVWSYGYLSGRALALAQQLRRLGVGPEARVAVLAERTRPERILGSLAAMVAGGAYVPLDPTYPAERLAFLFEDAGAEVVLTQRDLLERLPETKATVLCLEDFPEVPGTPRRPAPRGKPRATNGPGGLPEERGDEESLGRVDGANLAYVVYTSGSTGKPKGVQIPHDGLLNMVRWHQDYYGVTESDRATQVASPAFDASVWELWPYLTAGASVHVPDEDTRLSAPAMVDWWQDQRITLAYLPTALVEGVLREPIGPERPIGVRTIIIGGDRLVGRPLADAPYVLSNTYGPAEYTVLSTAVPVAPWGAVGEEGLPSIGLTIANTRLYVVEPGRAVAPVGVPGELWIGGVGLARGYLGRPGLTAERFVPDPFSGEPGARLYRSGDRIRRRPDGDFDFLGRFDFQVKLRGFRVELGEIESVLERHPGVAQVAVGVRAVGGGEVLVAWWVPAATECDEPEAGELGVFLRERLPAYMVPAAYLRLPRLPLTANGKVDRKALPAPEGTSQREHVPPRTATEAALVQIWEEILGLERVGVTDSFFELGGHSLLAVRVVSRIRERLGVELPLRSVFERSTPEALALAVEAASPQAGDGVPALVPVAREPRMPLSFAQERLWFIEQLNPGTPAYNVALATCFEGPLEVRRLAAAFLAVCDRHEVLRTRFESDGSRPWQVIEARVAFPTPVVDLSGLAAADVEQVVPRLANAEGSLPFDLERAPLLRATLLRRGERSHVVLMTQHHLVTDAWAMGLLIDELGAFYRAGVEGTPVGLPPLPVQYADYAVWQRRWLEGEELGRQLDYWRGHLAGAPQLHELPTDRPRPPIPSGRGATLFRLLGDPLAGRLHGLSIRSELTPFMTLVGGFLVLLSRLSGQNDLVVGTPVANRGRREIEGLIGFFLNVLPLRLDLSGNPPFQEALARVRSVAIEAYAHQDLPFERLVESLGLPRAIDRSPLFQISATVRRTDWHAGEMPGLSLSSLPVRSQTSRFDLSLLVAEGPWGFNLGMEHASDLFDAATIERWLAAFERMLTAAVEEPGRRIAALPLLSPGEERQLLVEWNATGRDWPFEGFCHELFAGWAEKRPDAAAVGLAGEVWSYGYLSGRARALAHRLRGLGVGPEVRVAVLAERSRPERILGSLAAMLAGGAYVPLDPTYPGERLAFLFEDAGARVILTQSDLLERLPETKATVLCLDGPDRQPEERSDEGSLGRVDGANLAYVVYTSGSTGRPKGVQISHDGLLNMVRWHQDYYEVTESDRATQVASPAFDASVWELWPYLAAGASVHVPDEETRLSAPAMVDWWQDQRITLAYLPTALVEGVLREPIGPERPIGVRTVIIGGDRLVGRPLPDAPYVLSNTYGPAEYTVLSTAVPVPAWGSGEEGLPSIGLTIANTRLYVVEPGRTVAPVGVPGELWIGGVGLARGYLGRPGLTAERFVPDPFSGEPGARLYRSGDRIRRRPDGDFDFLGRFDFQVKLRGFRVELGEIESVLERHPGVAQVAAGVRELGGGEVLVAWWVPVEAGTEPDAEALRAFLRERLPAYMVPAAYLRLPRLPLTANGKVDRKALPAPEGAGQGEHVPPRTSTEALLVQIWQEVLGLERVGVTDSFFELGGHSLLAVRVVSRIRERFGVEMPLRGIFEHLTVAELGAAVDQLRLEGRTGEVLPPLVPMGRDRPLPLSFAQERLWFIDRLTGGTAAYNVAMATRFEGELDLALLARCFLAVCDRHEVLRTRFVTEAGRPWQVIEPSVRFPTPLIDLSGLRPEDAEELSVHLTSTESFLPFDLERAPLLRATLLRLGPRLHAVLMTQHHLVTDAWAMGILIQELGTFYRAGIEGGEPGLPDLPVQYADYAIWQRQWLEGAELERQLAYWREHLAGAPQLHELPTDRPRPPYTSGRGATHYHMVESGLAERLVRLSAQTGLTNFMTLVGGFLVLMSRLSGQTDVVVGTPIANRNRRETEGLIGFFLNALVLRLDLGGDPTFGEALERLRRIALDAYAHQDLPFERLVESLGLPRAIDRSPLFQVAATVRRTDWTTGEMPGLTLSPQRVHTQGSRFDLSLLVAEGPWGFNLSLERSADLFDGATIERWLRAMERLLASAVEDPGRRISQLSLLAPAEERQLLVEWNDTAADYPREGWCHQLFAGWAARQPDAVAVSGEGEVWSYGHLHRRAIELARELRRLGVGPEARVVVLAERTRPERILGSLAVMLAGGAYVPLDPSYPAERLAFLFEDAGAAVVLTQRDLLGGLPETAARVLCLEDFPEMAGTSDDGLPEVPGTSVDGANLAYVVYTSGSTGRPKGVEIPHEGLLNMVRWHQDYYGVTAADRATQVASPAFDASVWELWPYLTAGASVHIPDEETRLSAPGMVEWWQRERITLAYLPTALVEGVMRVPIGPEQAVGVRTVIIGGDRLVGRPRPDAPYVLSNTYGPAEYTVLSTAVPVPPAEDAVAGLPSIGFTITNTRLYVVEPGRMVAPVGVPGELWIGGVGLARGYLGRPGLTAERFVPDPFSGEPGARLYRSGDRIRRRPDGDFDFLGRFDFQVKLRGFRVELGEIEAVLERCPGVGEAAVGVRDAGGGEVLVAWWVAAGAEPGQDEPSTDDLRAWLRDRLPAYMVPSAFLRLERLPLTANGKVDRRALPDPERASGETFVAPSTPTEEALARIWCELLHREEIGVEENFFDLGGHSLLVSEMQHRLRQELGVEIRLVDLFQHGTVRALSDHLAAQGQVARAGEAAAEPALLPIRRSRPRVDQSAIAVIGMAGRFPGAADPAALWRNVLGGAESISFFTPEELRAAGVPTQLSQHPRYVPAYGVIEDGDRFDAAFFGYSPREAQIMDPQQRLFLECSWQALEDAGYGAENGRGVVGLFAGSAISTYLMNLISNTELIEAVGSRAAIIGNDKDHLPNRVSYKLNLRGPSLSVQTACSTSLVAVHYACQSLLLGECDMALAGGVSIGAPLRGGYLYDEGGVVSPDGHCRSFDAEARGTVGGQAVAAVVLKPLERAIEDRDAIYAVIRGSAVNNDGSAKVGYTSPSIEGQALVIAQAQEAAGVDPRTIGFLEAHGTGTAVGDPIEVAALTRAFRRATADQGFCALGSLKPNVGHLDTAAGVAGLMKACYAVAQGVVPPSINFERPNPQIDFATSPFFVNTQAIPWPTNGGPRRAGVSSLGIGGTNAHVVVEEPPAAPEPGPGRPWQLALLSARDPAALDRLTDRLAADLAERPESDLPDVCFTLATGRQRLGWRRLALGRTPAELAGRLSDREVLDRQDEGSRRSVSFLFAGLGPEYVGMGRELYGQEAVYREVVERCCRRIEPALGFDLTEILLAEPPGSERAQEKLGEIAIALPALFIVQVALARLWMSWGVRPRAMLGHSNGELVAATLAGVFREEDGLALVVRRSSLMQQLPATGAMLAIPLGREQVEPFCGPGSGLSLALVNAADLCMVSGPVAAVETLEERLREEGLEVRRLRAATRAYHSDALLPAARELAAFVAGLERRPPTIPYVSNLTGTWIAAERAMDPEYWAEHLTRTVLFREGLGCLGGESGTVLLEVGPGGTIANLARRQLPERTVLSTLPGARDTEEAPEALLRTAGRLWLNGVDLDWGAYYSDSPRRRLHLPVYPFEGPRFWVHPGAPAAATVREPERLPPEDWTYLPQWRPGLPSALRPVPEVAGTWLLVPDRLGVAEELAAELGRRGAEVITVEAAERDFEVHRERLQALADAGRWPRGIVHLGTLTAAERPLEAALVELPSLVSVLPLLRALAGFERQAPTVLTVVSNRLAKVLPADVLEAEKTSLNGLLKVASQEIEWLRVAAVDLDQASPSRIPALLAELDGPREEGEDRVALRAGQRWLRSYQRARLPEPDRTPWREGGVYLLTGGLGQLGLVLARHLASQARAKLALVSRRSLPPREEWPALLAAAADNDPVAASLRAVTELEGLGAEVMLVSADVTDREELAEVIAKVEARFGTLHGVFHLAAAPGLGLLQQRGVADAAAVMAPKVEGTWTLIDLLRGRGLDFVAIYGSVAGTIGGIARGDYAAANSFIDGLVQREAPTYGTPLVAIDWAVWQMADLEAERAFQALLRGGTLALRQNGMRPEEGLAVLERALAAGQPQVVVATRDLERELRTVEDIRAGERGGGSAGPGAVSERPQLDTPYLAPRDELEEALCGLWGDLIGVDRVGIRDSFYELGGHSLLATQVTSRIRDRFQVELPLGRMLASPTVAELAVAIAELQAARIDDDQLSALLAEIGADSPGASEEAP